MADGIRLTTLDQQIGLTDGVTSGHKFLASQNYLDVWVELLEGTRGNEQPATGACCRVAQPVTMDTRPQCGVALSDSVITGYELGIRPSATVWRLAC